MPPRRAGFTDYDPQPPIFDPFGGGGDVSGITSSSTPYTAPAGGVPPVTFPAIPPTSLPVPPGTIAGAGQPARQPLQPQQQPPPQPSTPPTSPAFAPPMAPMLPPTPPPPAGTYTPNYGSYKPIAGWDVSKLNDQASQSNKYRFGRWIQDKGYDPAWARQNLSTIVSDFNAQFGTTAKAIGDDTIDFGGPGWMIDVINAGGYWQWLVLNPEQQPPAPPPAPPLAPPPDAPPTPPTGTAPGGTPPTGTLPTELPAWLLEFINSSSSSTPPPTPALPSGIAPDEGPEPYDPSFDVDAGQDPLSQLITSALGGVMQTGGTPYGQDVAATLGDLIGGGGFTPDLANRLIGAREDAGQLFQGLWEDARGTLADMGQLSVPGIEQGGTNRALNRITETVGQQLGRTTRDIETDALTRSNENVMQALSLATGMSQSMAANVLQAAGSATERQQMLSQIAMQSLGQNMEWQQFLAQYGLDHAQLAEEIANGRIQMIIPLLQLFLKGAEQAAGGFVD